VARPDHGMGSLRGGRTTLIPRYTSIWNDWNDYFILNLLFSRDCFSDARPRLNFASRILAWADWPDLYEGIPDIGTATFAAKKRQFYLLEPGCILPFAFYLLPFSFTLWNQGVLNLVCAGYFIFYMSILEYQVRLFGNILNIQ
jgi:hypothetical protein